MGCPIVLTSGQNPSDGSVQEGFPLLLILHVYDVDNGSCVPLSGAQVDIWHANSQGVYSGVQDAGTYGKEVPSWISSDRR